MGRIQALKKEFKLWFYLLYGSGIIVISIILGVIAENPGVMRYWWLWIGETVVILLFAAVLLHLITGYKNQITELQKRVRPDIIWYRESDFASQLVQASQSQPVGLDTNTVPTPA